MGDLPSTSDNRTLRSRSWFRGFSARTVWSITSERKLSSSKLLRRNFQGDGWLESGFDPACSGVPIFPATSCSQLIFPSRLRPTSMWPSLRLMRAMVRDLAPRSTSPPSRTKRWAANSALGAPLTPRCRPLSSVAISLTATWGLRPASMLAFKPIEIPAIPPATGDDRLRSSMPKAISLISTAPISTFQAASPSGAGCATGRGFLARRSGLCG